MMESHVVAKPAVFCESAIFRKIVFQALDRVIYKLLESQQVFIDHADVAIKTHARLDVLIHLDRIHGESKQNIQPIVYRRGVAHRRKRLSECVFFRHLLQRCDVNVERYRDSLDFQQNERRHDQNERQHD